MYGSPSARMGDLLRKMEKDRQSRLRALAVCNLLNQTKLFQSIPDENLTVDGLTSSFINSRQRGF